MIHTFILTKLELSLIEGGMVIREYHLEVWRVVLKYKELDLGGIAMTASVLTHQEPLEV